MVIWELNILIYLDQNTLSNLRQRTIDSTEHKDFSSLKSVLSSPKIEVVYSHVTLTEIQQIKLKKYKDEHIYLLNDLDAKYIDPQTRILSNKTSIDIWFKYLETTKLNAEIGISNLLTTNQLSSRKLSGLPIDNSFEEIHQKTNQALSELFSNCEQLLADCDIDELDEPIKTYVLEAIKQFSNLKEQNNILEPPITFESQSLGPKLFRNIPEVKALEIEQLPYDQVVNAIEATFKKEHFNWKDYLDDTVQNAVTRAYSLMNWAGYHPDDFDKVKKRKDRFNASQNDMQHVASATGVDFLISDDKNFIKKANACYAYINANTLACSPEDFLSNHYQTKQLE